MLLQIQEQTVVAHCVLILLQVVVDFFGAHLESVCAQFRRGYKNHFNDKVIFFFFLLNLVLGYYAKRN